MIEKTTQTTKAPVGATAKKQAKKMTAAPMPMPAMASEAPKDGGPDDYEAKHAFEDIMKAEQHKQNPDLMMRVQKHVKRHKRVIKNLDDLKKVANMTPEERNGAADTDEDGE